MKKIFSSLLLTMMVVAASAQAKKDTTYVMVNFTDNPWNYPVTEVTKKWYPDFEDLESPGSILEPKDFSWAITAGSDEKVKITVYPNDWMETYKAPVFGRVNIDGSDAAALYIPEGQTNVLYTLPGTTMRFEAPEGYDFGKMVFYTFHSSNMLVGDEYDEPFSYTYGSNTFTQNLKVWTPTCSKANPYGYSIWQGDVKNVLFNYTFFSAHFVKIEVRLVPDGTSGIETVKSAKNASGKVTTLDGRTINKSEGLRKGIYIEDGRKYVVK